MVQTAGTGLAKREPGKRWKQEDIDRGLLAIVLHGRFDEASQASGVPAETLRYWKKHKAERLAQIAHEQAPELRKRLAAEYDSLVQRKLDAQRRLLERFDPEQVRQADIPKGIQALTTSAAIDVDKTLLLRGQPTVITQHQDATELLDKISRLAPGAVVEGTAEEITE